MCSLLVVGKRVVVRCCLKEDHQRKQEKILMVQESRDSSFFVCRNFKTFWKNRGVSNPQQTNNMEVEFIYPKGKRRFKMVKLGNYIRFGFWPLGAFSLFICREAIFFKTQSSTSGEIIWQNLCMASTTWCDKNAQTPLVRWSRERHTMNSRHLMYGIFTYIFHIFTYIYHAKLPKVGRYTIYIECHGDIASIETPWIWDTGKWMRHDLLEDCKSG